MPQDRFTAFDDSIPGHSPLAATSLILGRAGQAAFLFEVLDCDEVRSRPPGVQRSLDELIALCARNGEYELGIALCGLMGLRVKSRAHVAPAADLLMGLLLAEASHE